MRRARSPVPPTSPITVASGLCMAASFAGARGVRSTPWWVPARRARGYAPPMPGAPGQPHGSTPVELQQRLDAERLGVPFLLDRDGEQRQVLVALERERLTIGRRAAN